MYYVGGIYIDWFKDHEAILREIMCDMEYTGREGSWPAVRVYVRSYLMDK